MDPSGLRRGLLSGPPGNPNQLSIEQADLADAEIDAQLAEDAAVWDQLRSLARVVTIAFASDPNGIFDLGWGDIELLDDRGTVNWLHWEPLALNNAAGGTGRHLQAVQGPGVGAGPAGPRFDDVAATDDDDLPMRARPAIGEPQREVEPPADETGTDNGPTDESR